MTVLHNVLKLTFKKKWISQGLFVTPLLISHARYVCMYHILYVCGMYIHVQYLVLQIGEFVCGGQMSTSNLSQSLSN